MEITLDNGEMAQAICPLIISASRSTDIPAFYSDWFFERLRKGYSTWISPFNGRRCVIAYERARFIVFWSKNPASLLKHLDFLNKSGIGCYIQYSLNDYETDGLERGVPPLEERIRTFKALVARLGKGGVIWRSDPLLLTESIGIETLLGRIRRIGDKIHEYAEKMVFSFADILNYAKVRRNLESSHIPYRNWTIAQMQEFAGKLLELNEREGWKLELATCGETADLEGITHNRCIDDRLILRFKHDSPELLKFLGAEIRHGSLQGNLLDGASAAKGVDLGDGRHAIIQKQNRDQGQREACGCIRSKDIGQYDTCVHLCEYCYATASKKSAQRNNALHKANPHAETITGR